MPQINDAPLYEPLVSFSSDAAQKLHLDPKHDGIISALWYTWFWQELIARVNQSAQQVGTVVSQQGLSASQPTTPITTGPLAAGRYLVSVHQKVRQAAGVSSAIATAIGYTNNGVACAQSVPSDATNTPASVKSGVFMLVIDQDSPITWATTYASVGAPAMSYDIDVAIQALN